MSKLDIQEKIYDYLCEEIMNGTLRPCKNVTEQDIANRFGVSRSPVRDVFSRLEKDGLLKYVPNKGFFVTEITQRDIDEVCDLRKMFEIYCLKYCIENISDEDITRMRELLSRVDSEEKIREYFTNNESVHRRIQSFCPNQLVHEFIKMIDKKEERLRRTFVVVPNRIVRVQTAHAEIIDMLALRDYDKAAEALSNHLDAVHEQLVYAYKQSQNDTVNS